MGSGASAKRQVDRLQERDIRNQVTLFEQQHYCLYNRVDLKFQVEKDQVETDLTTKYQEKLYELQSEKFDLTERLRKAEGALTELSNGLDKEKQRNLALTFSELTMHSLTFLHFNTKNRRCSKVT